MSEKADGKPPVLVVDDDRAIREAMKALLELAGYNVAAAADGEDALRVLHHGLEPCLILLDLMMPRMDGFEFRRRQMEDAKLADIPVVVYSGHYDAKSSAARLGVTEYLQKPVDVRRMLDLVEHYCQQAAASCPRGA